MDSEKIAAIIKKIRKDNNMTQQEFANKFGVTYQAVSKWENGKNIPDISILKEICSEYNVKLEDFLNGNIKKDKNNKSKLIIVISIIFILLVCLVLFIVFNNGDFKFKVLSSDCKNFDVSGSIAYDKEKSSIYISDVSYCGKEDINEYKDIKCTLYESNDKVKKEISHCDYSDSKSITLQEFLKSVNFHVDDYIKTCKNYNQNTLNLEIDATSLDGNVTSYKIPLKLNDNCSN